MQNKSIFEKIKRHHNIMKRFSILILTCFVGLLSAMFTSCDKEANDPVFDNKELVGKPEFVLTLKDSTYFRNNIVAYLGSNNHLTIRVERLGKAQIKGQTGLDDLIIELATFSKATFPFTQDGKNKNVSDYLLNFTNNLPEVYSTINTKSPNNARAGVFTLSDINNYVNVISGSFDFTLQPNATNTKNTEPIRVSGYFTDIPFVREGMDGSKEYMYMFVDSDLMTNVKLSAMDIVPAIPIGGLNVDTPVGGADTEKKIKVNAQGNTYTKFNLDIIFPDNIELKTKHAKGYEVKYVSKYGEKYDNSPANLLDGSYLRIDRKENKVVNGKNVQEIAGRFEFHLKNNLGTAESQISQGEFVVYKPIK